MRRAERKTGAAEKIITSRPGEGFTPAELAAAMEERGVPIRSDDPARAARAVGDRVRARNGQVDLEDGRFVYRPANGRIHLEAFESPGSGQEDSPR